MTANQIRHAPTCTGVLIYPKRGVLGWSGRRSTEEHPAVAGGSPLRPANA